MGGGDSGSVPGLRIGGFTATSCGLGAPPLNSTSCSSFGVSGHRCSEITLQMIDAPAGWVDQVRVDQVRVATLPTCLPKGLLQEILM